MLNLDKLNSIDFSRLDANQVIKLLSENQKFIKLALLVFSLFMAWSMFSNFHTKQSAIDSQASLAQKKIDVIKGRQTAVQSLNDYKSSIPKGLDVFQLVKMVTTAAQSENTTVISYTPSQSKDMGLYDLINVNFTVVSDNFKDMMLFLRKIETSKSPVYVSSWAGQEGNDGKVSFNIAIRAVLIHT